MRREVLWDVHVGHTWRHDRAQRHQTEPLWKSLEAVEQDLLDMQAVHRYLRDRETRNRLCAPSALRCCVSLPLQLRLDLRGLREPQRAQPRPCCSFVQTYSCIPTCSHTIATVPIQAVPNLHRRTVHQAKHSCEMLLLVVAAVQRMGDKIVAYAVLRWATLVCALHPCHYTGSLLPVVACFHVHNRSLTIHSQLPDRVCMCRAAVSMFQIHFIRRLFDNSKHSHAGPNRL